MKSGHNKLINNTFIESRGTLTLRHGNNNLVKGNVFMGNNVPNTGGVRVINEGQEVADNVFFQLTGYRFGSGFTVMNGVPNSPINRYHQVKHANIHHNTFIDVDHIQFAAGSDAERSAVPIESQFSNNLVISTNGGKSPSAFSFFDDVSGIQFTDNVANYAVPEQIAAGFSVRPNLQSYNLQSLQPITVNQQNVGAPTSVKPMAKSAVGPSWYSKRAPEGQFDTGKTITVTPGKNALFDAITNASDGDRLLLTKGVYNEAKIIPVSKTITIVGENHDVHVLPQRSTLFEIQNGGNLALENLVLSGQEAPDSTGNTLIRTLKWGMLVNYRLHLNNVRVENLDVNHSFHVFRAGDRSFAKSIRINNSKFVNVTGDVLQLNQEQDDLGVYNVEHLDINNNEFTSVQGAIALVYRGGTDESTFGPQITVGYNQFTDTGKGKRNKAKASLYFHGVQLTNIHHNVFNQSAPVRIETTVGEPKNVIKDNQFEQTPKPTIIDFLAVAAGNTSLKQLFAVK